MESTESKKKKSNTVADDSPTDLSALLRPKSVAVIGASTRVGSIGGQIFSNLLDCRFRGPVYPINPGATSVQSVHAYASLAEVPGPVDLAVIVIPRALVLDSIRECARKGVRGIVVITAGYKETGEEGAREEAKLQALVRESGIRLIGPNCLGALSTDPSILLNATFAPTYPPEGNVAIASQSGALGLVILDYARDYNIGISEFVSMGNKADVSGNDLIAWWDRDPRTKVILLYLESFGNPRRFIRLARNITHRKPVVAVKSGRSLRGSKAASSHTGALAGAEAAVDGLMAQTGVIRVDTVDELFHMAAFLAHQPVPRGNRTAILTNAGGPGILATDACETLGLEVPDLSPETVEKLRGFLAPEASVKNPVDMIASAEAEEYKKAITILLADPSVDSLIVIYVPPVVTEPGAVGKAIVQAADGSKKPVLSCFLGRQGVHERLKSTRKTHVPSYAFPETAVRVLSRAVRYGEWLSRPEGMERVFDDIDRPRSLKAMQSAGRRLSGEDGWMSSGEIEELLSAYGIRLVPSRFGRSSEEAVSVAEEVGFPVVLKLDSDTLVHKTEVGGVRLDLRNAEEVARAYREIRETLESKGMGEAMRGVQIQPLIREGVEVIAGAMRDPLFGPLIMFGGGGIQVEVLRDVAFRIHPLTVEDAREMIREIKGFPLLDGFRGAPPADLEALENLLLRLSRLVADHDEIQEVDLNPVKVLSPGKGYVAVDARIRLGTSGPPRE